MVFIVYVLLNPVGLDVIRVAGLKNNIDNYVGLEPVNHFIKAIETAADWESCRSRESSDMPSQGQK